MPSGDDQTTVGFAVPPSLAAITARYELLCELGRGGMGVVYKARDVQTRDLVAVKVLHPSAASDPAIVDRFRNELLLARRITHKNVCRVFDLNEFAGTTVISMEFVEGRSLRELLREVESLSTRRGLKIVRQIAAGLVEAHAQGVVHRDLKPENILIGRDGTVKIMDFGIARLLDARVTATGDILGTPAYMSPEQAEGRPADARSDIYALGLVMYEMFCGRPPFSGDTPIALAAKHVSEMPVAPRAIEADLPPRIDAAIRRCLEKNPAKRFQSVGQLDAALAGDSDTGETARAELPQRLARWQRSDWLLVAAAFVALAAFLASFARVSLAPRSQVTFERSVLLRIVEEHLQRLGAPTVQVRPAVGGLEAGAYVYLARTYGAEKARDLANNPVHYWTWAAAFDGGSIEVDNRGRIVSFSRPQVPAEASERSFEDAKRLAARTIEEFFGQPASALQPEHETRGPVYEFAWLGAEIAPGLRQRFTVSVDKIGVASLRSVAAIPPGYTMDAFPFGEITMNEWGMPAAVLVGMAVCVIGFLNRRRVTQGARWRAALTAIGFIVGASQAVLTMRFNGIGDTLSVSAGFGVLFAGIVYLGSIALEALSRRSAAGTLDTMAALFENGRGREAAGLAIVRGCGIGLVLLAVDSSALWLATTRLGARLSMIHVGLLGLIINTATWPSVLVWGICLVQMVGIGLLVALTNAAAARLPVPAWVSGLGAAALLAASGVRLSMGTVEPWPFTAGLLFVDYTLLLVVARRYDLLTLSAAIGTFGLWWANYTLFVMQQPIGAAGPWITFVMWGLCAAGATAAAFQTGLRGAYRRIAAAFE
jgi:predicted Ser/Thr protein kinase